MFSDNEDVINAIHKMEQRVHAHINQNADQLNTLAQKVQALEQHSRINSAAEVHLTMNLGIVASDLNALESFLATKFTELKESVDPNHKGLDK